MRNPFTFRIESSLGAVFVLLLGGFFVSVLFVVMKNFNSDIDILTTEQAQVKSLSSSQRALIEAWARDNNVEIPEGQGYYYLIRMYPDKPWLK